MLNPRHHIGVLGMLAMQFDVQAQVVERVGVFQRFFITDGV